jgi:hypothetical protein
VAKLAKYEKAHKSLEKGLLQLAEKLKGIDIDAEDVEFIIQRIAVQSQNALEIAKERRTLELEPYEPEVKRIKARWKPLIDGFETVFKTTKRVAGDILRKRRALEEMKRAEARKKLLEAELAAKKKASAKQKALVHQREEEARKELEALPPEGAPLGIKTEKGTLHVRKVWRWKLEDVNLVPKPYVQVLIDGKKVDLAVKNGKRKIPGLKIYQDEEMASRRA